METVVTVEHFHKRYGEILGIPVIWLIRWDSSGPDHSSIPLVTTSTYHVSSDGAAILTAVTSTNNEISTLGPEHGQYS